MSHWINKQNKKHAKLFSKEYRLLMFDQHLDWGLGELLQQRSNYLNKRVIKMSPRRSSKMRMDLINELIEGDLVQTDWEQISEVLEEDTDDYGPV